ncbi:TPA: helix-turn-helix transcriptional regulator [Clostridioides difficile]|uniref:Transcriptional regulator, AbrB family n=2 Tax=Clostridioides difficile TaxID=1496 RepID=Q184V8_CLOD6|nr:helix-turn-helix transcriptional regulator [Clostridioides difficile]EQF59838.1 transcriptional regulator, AbrB family domain protein [Clostridioides difficile CD196]EQG59020.1 transcriptional regulator, AbrB family domain protein [Clostridioides difficile DA00149]EQI28363.1 transcriptional regulator, AbrB family domain protein [Clostridioides difficile Y184]EQK79961.1 transcriptional regulator, AbrB family domain protein [Clostridioides difficile CD127]OFU06895.1 AbrB family transcriptiona
MINENLKSLRKINQYTQEELAEKLNVSRQSIAKWESGESIPDICSCIKLAKLYNVKLDDLVNHSEEKTGIIVPPKGKFFFGAVVVGERGQIVIPKEAREVFNINAGDKLLVLGDEERGLGIVHQRDLINFIGHVGVVRKEE